MIQHAQDFQGTNSGFHWLQKVLLPPQCMMASIQES
jgi:hypothetical protein